MTTFDPRALELALDALPLRYPGPGGVAGIVRNGQVIAARAWGHADTNLHLPMTTSTRLPICSISKQFTCALLLSVVKDPSQLDVRLATLLPDFRDRLPTTLELCHNQSGLRDYWALTVLQGATAEQTFARGDALPLLRRMRTGHFAPGMGYSYNNSNFRLLGEMIEAETGADFGDLLVETLFAPAGMEHALLSPDSRHPVDDVVGYEGCEERGYLPADNGIYWFGDAGISASLDDMLAWERWIDNTRDDPDGLYNRMSQPVVFRNGKPADYGFGLRRSQVAGLSATGHGGALRGFRTHRLHAAEARLSAVVMFNHEANARAATAELLGAALGARAAPPAPPPPGWDGQWICETTGLLTRITSTADTAVLHFGTGAEVLHGAADGGLEAPGVRLHGTRDGVRMVRPFENLDSRLVPLPAIGSGIEVPRGDEIAGRYALDETGSEMEIEARDGAVHAWFEGMLGTGAAERLRPAGPDTWLLATRRSMDAPAPGDWTLRFTRDAAGKVSGGTLGCWLARGITFRRL